MCKIDAAEALQDFPVLTQGYLRSLTVGVYQLKQALSYSSEHGDGGYEIIVGKNNSDILQAKIQSRHVSSKSYYLWIQYDSADTEDPDELYSRIVSADRVRGWLDASLL